MTLYNDPNTRRKIVMKHYSSPDNKSDLSNKKTIEIRSLECVDKLKLYIKWEDNKVKEAVWDGIGCAVFQSSTDIFLNIIKNKTKDEIKQIVSDYQKLINGEAEYTPSLKELNVFDNVGKQLNRLHCAEMVVRAIKKAL